MSKKETKEDMNQGGAWPTVGKLDYNNMATLDVLRNSVAKGTTAAEFSYFVSLCQSTGLNPIKKEIWCIVTSPDTQYRRCQIMIGLMGFFAIANRHPQFDAIEYTYGPLKKIKLPDNNEGVKEIEVYEWIEALTYRKDRSRPQVFRLAWSEAHGDLVTHKKALGIWAKKPQYMHTKCAESHSLKRAFPQELGELYSEAEMPQEFQVVQNEIAEPETYQTEPRATDSLKEVDGQKVYSMKPKTIENADEPEEVTFSHIYDVMELLESDERADKFEQYFENIKDAAIAEREGHIVRSVQELTKLSKYEVK